MDTLKVWRTRRMLTQLELAEKAGVAVSTVSSIEQESHPPRLRVIRKIADVLAVDPMEVTEFAKAIEAAGTGKAARE